MIEFYATVARKSMKGFSAEGWHSEQAVSREQAQNVHSLAPPTPLSKKTTKAQSNPANSPISPSS